ncbi:MAG: MFS transporter [Chloroflexi bacterium]|nr:MFS transporter [Chloroflexota bacterium]
MLSSDIQKLEQDYPDYMGKVKKNYWWNFVVIMLDSAIFTFSVTMLSQDTIIPYYITQLTSQKFFIGLAPALYFLGYYLPQLFGAYLVNGKPTRKRFIFGVAIFQRFCILLIALLTQLLGFLTSLQALILLLFSFALYSVSAGLIMPAYNDFISKTIIRRRGIFYGSMNGLGGLIGFGASLTATYYLGHYDFPANLQTLFWLALAVSLVSPFFIAVYREVPFPSKTEAEPLGQFLKSIPGHVRSASGFGRFMVVRSLLNLGLMANAFFSIYAIQEYSLPDSVLGILTMIILISQSAAGFLWGWLGDRFGFKIVYVIAAVMVLLMGLLAVSDAGAWVFYVIAGCIGASYAVTRTADANMVFELAPPSETSRFIGIANTFVAPVATLGPLVGGLIVDLLSYRALFGCVAVIGVVSLALTVAYLPSRRPAAIDPLP